ncbi:hypothetical protein EI94DRAFT_966454 [Lactarius quietus]|nr:hypothetical protein EI94DRAFT_966454 [Lactarius quietus]
MFQPTRHIGFPHHPHPSFHTDRTIFHSEGPILGGTGWCSTTIDTKVQTTNGWSPCWVDPKSLPPASAPWHSARTSPTSHRPLHIGTWPTAQPSFSGPTMPRNRTIQWCAAPTTPSSARANTSFSCPSTSRKQVRFASPPRTRGAFRTSFGDPPLLSCMHSTPQAVRMIPSHNSKSPFRRSRR